MIMYFMAIPSIKRPYESTSNEKYPLTPKLRCVCSLRPDGTYAIYGDGWDLRFAPNNFCRKLASVWVNLVLVCCIFEVTSPNNLKTVPTHTIFLQ